jgi:hypothetical protein
MAVIAAMRGSPIVNPSKRIVRVLGHLRGESRMRGLSIRPIPTTSSRTTRPQLSARRSASPLSVR